MCIANPFIAVLAILGWGMVAVVAIIVLMVLIALVLTPNVKAVMRAATKVELLISAIDLIVNKTVQARVTPKNISALSVIKSFILVIPFFTVTTL